MRLGSPWLLALAALLPLVWPWRRGSARTAALRFPTLAGLRAVAPAGAARRRIVLAVLRLVALVLLAVALARPQAGTAATKVHREGVDVVLAVDVSGSMLSEDFTLGSGRASRLDAVKAVVKEFVAARAEDRIGLVLFGARPYTQCPLTLDHGWLLQNLERAKVGMIEDGTAIGSGLATSLTRLRRSQAKSKVIVLVTDGANNAGEIDPATATDVARAMEVRVYTIGVGRGGMVPMPVQVQDPFTGRVSRRMMMTEVQIDEGLLKRIADRTGGEFFRATDSASLRNIFDRIDRLEKSEIKLSSFRRYRELFFPVLLLAAAMLAAAGGLWAAGLRVAPA